MAISSTPLPSRPGRRPTTSVLAALHRRRTRWIATAFVAVVLGSITATTISDAQHSRARWGATRTVAVARHDLAPGTSIGDDDVTIAERPLVVVPADATDLAIGRTVTAPIAADEVVLDRRLAAGGLTGTDALLPTDAVAFAVPTEHSTPKLDVGDHVDVFAPTTVAGKAPTATRIATSAAVVAVTEKSVTIAVVPTQAPAVARALLDTAVVLAVTR